MRVFFRSNHLRRCNEDAASAARTWGPTVGALYRRRVQLLIETERFQELFALRALGSTHFMGSVQVYWPSTLTSDGA